MRTITNFSWLLGPLLLGIIACAEEDVDAIHPNDSNLLSSEHTVSTYIYSDEPTVLVEDNLHPSIDLEETKTIQLRPFTSYENCPQTPMGQLGHHFHLYSQVSLRPSITQRNIALMTVYLPQATFRPNTLPYLQGLQASGWEVVLIINTQDKKVFQSPSLQAELVTQSGAEVVLFRENLGYDFSGWYDALQLMPYLWTSNLLLLTNDSMLGPVNKESMDHVQQQVEVSSAEVIYLTESIQTKHHYQSYFIVLKPKVRMRSETVHFFCHIEPHARKSDVINFLEFGLSQHWQDHGIPVEVLFPICDALDCRGISPTHQHWQALLESGFPLLKMDLVRGFAQHNLTDYCRAAELTSTLGYNFYAIDGDYATRCQAFTQNLSPAVSQSVAQ